LRVAFVVGAFFVVDAAVVALRGELRLRRSCRSERASCRPFAVTKAAKGAKDGDVVTVDVARGNCGFTDLHVGETWSVYARRRNGNHLETTACDGTSPG